jgi:aldehyde:ferredoxin oxidoreductase
MARRQDRILEIDMGAPFGPRASNRPLGRYVGLCGETLASLLVSDEVDPACHPLGAANRLVFAPGACPLASRASASSMAICFKSPLTGTFEVACADGQAAAALEALGYAAVILSGQPAGWDFWKVILDQDGVSFATDAATRALGTRATIERLRRLHGGAAFLAIGPAGEMRLGAASITCADMERGPSSVGHGGAGAVMGSKRVKAIVVDVGQPPSVHVVRHGVGDGAQPEPAYPRRPGHDIGCGIEDPVAIAELERMECDLGLDPAEAAAAVGIAMQAGLARYGDGWAALQLLSEVGSGTPLGRILGSGASATKEALGVDEALRKGCFSPGGPGPDGLH